MKKKTLKEKIVDYGAGVIIASSIAGLSGCATFKDAPKKDVPEQTTQSEFQLPAGKGKDKTPLADLILDSKEFQNVSTPQGEEKKTVFELTDSQLSQYGEALSLLARDSALVKAGEEISAEQKTQMHESLSWVLQAKPSDKGEELYLRPLVQKSVGSVEVKEGQAARFLGDFALELSAEQAAALGYEAPKVKEKAKEVVAELSNPILDKLGELKAPEYNLKFSEEELAKLAEGKTDFDPSEEKLQTLDATLMERYTAWGKLFGDKEKEARAASEKLHDLRFSADKKHAYVSGKDDKDQTVIHSFDLGAKASELENTVRLSGDVSNHEGYQAFRAKSREMLTAKRTEVGKLGLTRKDLQENFYTVADLKAHAEKSKSEDALEAVKALESFADPNFDPYLGKLMQVEGAEMHVRYLAPEKRAPFVELEVYAEGKKLGGTTRTFGNGLKWGAGLYDALEAMKPAKAEEQPKAKKSEKKSKTAKSLKIVY